MKNKNTVNEHGAVIVEGTVSLFLFTFFMYAVLSVSQLAYVQSRVNVALDISTKLIAEYSHVYFLTGLNEVANNSGGYSSQKANSIANSDVTEFLGELSKYLSGTGAGDITGTIYNGLKAFEDDSLGDFVEQLVGEGAAKGLLEKNLNNNGGTSFAERYHIVSGFDLSDSKLFVGDKREIFMIAKYKIELPILKFFGINHPFNMMACSFSRAWGDG